MLDREIGVARPQPEPSAPLPATSGTRIEFQAAVEQGDGDGDFFAEVAECVSRLTEDIRIVAGYLKGPLGECDAFPATYLRVLGPAVDMHLEMAGRCLNQSGAVARIALDHLL